MSLKPQQPDQPFDDAIDSALAPELLDEALQAQETPADLEAKVLALTDPALLSLLDEALAPQACPDQLADRIIAATSPDQAQRDERPAVLARIQPNTWRYAAAAAIAIAAGIGFWVTQQPDNNTVTPIADTTKTLDNAASPAEAGNNSADNTNAVAATWPDSENTFDSENALFALATEPFENEIDAVSQDIDNVSIDADSIWAELDAYEQFLTETGLDDNTPAT